MIEMFKKHINKILVLFCIIGMIMAPDNASFAVVAAAADVTEVPRASVVELI